MNQLPDIEGTSFTSHLDLAVHLLLLDHAEALATRPGQMDPATGKYFLPDLSDIYRDTREKIISITTAWATGDDTPLKQYLLKTPESEAEEEATG